MKDGGGTASDVLYKYDHGTANHIQDSQHNILKTGFLIFGKMAFALRLLFLVCGISALLTGVWSFQKIQFKDNNCPKGWTRLGCHCYIYQDEPRDFADAESICNILDANLVSIHNDLENAFVVELIRASGNTGQTWIGYTDAIEEGDFVWTDGSAQDFVNFDITAAPSEPNNTGDCVAISLTDGLWRDEQCTDIDPYICIKEVSH
ncbi:galactose-specific lectin nattectin-like isoform X2 [Hippocampus zosterae]|uniref:galactose-specific lectin nattectin-like isoform X2 n=1 Tax=Hippocampus zosterae TaxID=109293 RepID=UPI00223D419B|nr:galactose-specific lectin nattectin-like isoform X2 [Hippocampus zosterae]